MRTRSSLGSLALALALATAPPAAAATLGGVTLPDRATAGRRGYRGALLAAATIAILLATGRPAAANSFGITGYSGKQGGNCTDCHSGGVEPEVRFVGPTMVAPGEMATFRFEVISRAVSQRRAGFNVASSEGALAIDAAQGGRRLPNNELTHNIPKENVEGVASWEFTWTAPTELGTYTLFGAGNSVNFNNQQTGDRSNKTTHEVLVGEITFTGSGKPWWREAFSALDVGMTLSQVTALTGQPARIHGDDATILTYQPTRACTIEVTLRPRLVEVVEVTAQGRSVLVSG